MNDNRNILSEIIKVPSDNPKFIEKCNLLADKIDSGEYLITNLVIDFGSLLSSSVTNEREKGILVLSSILAHISHDSLNVAQLIHLCNFYADKLNENHQVVPSVLQGLVPLISFEETPAGSSLDLFRNLSQYVPCQQQMHSDRLNIYKFIKTLLDKKAEEMDGMGIDFVHGVINMIEGERDPRNLLFIFSWLPKYLQRFDVAPLAEEAFEVISSYFPVDFRAANDENCVTRDALASALCPCLCAVPEFAKFCIPLALVKLNSELLRAKLDSLNLLREGCKHFPVDVYKRHFIESWSTIQKEVFTNTDTELKENCLATLTCILKKVSEDGEFLKETVVDMVDTLKGNLTPNAALFTPSIKLLKAVSNATLQCIEIVFKKISCMLINIFNITTTPLHKAKVLEELVNFAVIYLLKDNAVLTIETNELSLVPTTCLKAMTSTDYEVQISSIHGLSHLAKFLPMSTRTYVYQNLSVLLLTQHNPHTFKSLMICLKAFAELYPGEIQNILENMQNNDTESHKSYLRAIGVVASIKEFKLFSVSALMHNISGSFDISMIATEILCQKIEENELFLTTDSVNVANIFDTIVDYLLEHGFDLEIHEKFLNNFAKIMNITIRNLDAHAQLLIVEKQLMLPPSKTTEVKIVIYFGLLTSLQNHLTLQIDIVKEILEIILTTNFEYISLLGCQTLANILNKVDNEEALTTLLNYTESRCSNWLCRNQKNVFNVMAFTAKALLVKNHPKSQVWVTHLIQISATYLKAAQSFGILLDDNFDCLSSKSFCIRKLLYKQKFFAKMTTYLVDNYSEENRFFLAILGYMLPHVAQQILQNELRKTMRLVLLCIGYCEESPVLEGVLTTMNTIIVNKEEIVKDYVQEFLKYYLKLTSFEKSMNVRILALNGVQIFSTFPLYKVLPMKQDTLMQLSRCLDDKKRLVRREAVKARSKWFLIDAPI